VNNDSVEELENPENSVDLILTSIPFTQYEYTPSYNDFGHTDRNEHFFPQMDSMTPRLHKVLTRPASARSTSRDRIVPEASQPWGLNSLSVPRSDDLPFRQARLSLMGMKTIVTDVVRENNQTYRLGWTEQCKDGTKMGVGMPEYLLIFRKPPTDTTNAYADDPVVKHKPLTIDEETGETGPYDKNNKHQHIILNSGYSRARWQLDAHGFERSSGNRLLTGGRTGRHRPSAITKVSPSLHYDRVRPESHVAIAGSLEQRSLPVKTALCPSIPWTCGPI
jgi:hypothetical protein